ncbi:GNAT family N-acetyltransferase [Paenibacillus sp. FSL L8-0708]|uniref:GNAT family N-acetyltransferase n=1 Tax=Paenibacillus sp. FSL L8-0708 TaxID=2975311 RepID=UPI0030F890A7
MILNPGLEVHINNVKQNLSKILDNNLEIKINVYDSAHQYIFYYGGSIEIDIWLHEATNKLHYASYTTLTVPTLFISIIRITPSRQGLGSTVLNEFINFSKVIGIGRISAVAENSFSENFFKKNGFIKQNVNNVYSIEIL